MGSSPISSTIYIYKKKESILQKKYTRDELLKACASSYSYSEVARKLNYASAGGGTIATIKRKIQDGILIFHTLLVKNGV